MRKIVLTITLAFLCVIGYSSTSASAAENSTNLGLNKSVSGVITDDDPSDYYTISLGEAGKLSLDVSSYMPYMNVALYDENHDVIMENSSFEDADENNPTPWKEGKYLEPGTYTVKVSQEDDYTGNYRLNATFNAANNNEVEPNNGIDLAQPLTLNESQITGLISWNDSTDYYKLDVKKAGKLSVDFSSYMAYVNIDVLDENYESIMSDDSFSGASENTAIPTNLSTYLEAGTYYIKVSEDDENGRYKLKANFTEAKNNEIEPNNGVDQAQTISANTQKVTGLISWNDTADFYKVNITKAGKLTVNTYSYIRWLDVDVYDSKMQNVLSYADFGDANENTSILNSDTAVVKAGTYYISIKQDSGYGKYKLFVKAPSMLPKSPTVNKVKKGAKKITGKTAKNSTVTVKIGSKKYTGKSNSAGKFSIKVPAQKAKSKIYVSVKTSAGTSASAKVVVK